MSGNVTDDEKKFAPNTQDEMDKKVLLHILSPQCLTADIRQLTIHGYADDPKLTPVYPTTLNTFEEQLLKSVLSPKDLYAQVSRLCPVIS